MATVQVQHGEKTVSFDVPEGSASVFISKVVVETIFRLKGRAYMVTKFFHDNVTVAQLDQSFLPGELLILGEISTPGNKEAFTTAEGNTGVSANKVSPLKARKLLPDFVDLCSPNISDDADVEIVDSPETRKVNPEIPVAVHEHANDEPPVEGGQKFFKLLQTGGVFRAPSETILSNVRKEVSCAEVPFHLEANTVYHLPTKTPQEVCVENKDVASLTLEDGALVLTLGESRTARKLPDYLVQVRHCCGAFTCENEDCGYVREFGQRNTNFFSGRQGQGAKAVALLKQGVVNVVCKTCKLKPKWSGVECPFKVVSVVARPNTSATYRLVFTGEEHTHPVLEDPGTWITRKMRKEVTEVVGELSKSMKKGKGAVSVRNHLVSSELKRKMKQVETGESEFLP